MRLNETKTNILLTIIKRHETMKYGESNVGDEISISFNSALNYTDETYYTICDIPIKKTDYNFNKALELIFEANMYWLRFDIKTQKEIKDWEIQKEFETFTYIG